MTYTRTLGRSNITISALGMGCWAIGGRFLAGDTPLGWGAVDDAESTRAIHRALDLGVTFFDTADVYGAGHSERVLGGRWAGRRERGGDRHQVRRRVRRETPPVTGSDQSPEVIRQACEASLARLETDYIDLYQFHDGGYPRRWPSGCARRWRSW